MNSASSKAKGGLDVYTRGAPSVRDLIGDHLSELRPSERKVARALLADYPGAGLRTMASLAQHANVSAPTVMRFSTALGFGSFSDVQAALHRELSLRSEGPIGSVRWKQQEGSNADLVVTSGEKLAQDAAESLRAVPPSEIDTVVELLSNTSRQVFIAGGRYSTILAQHLATNLSPLRPKVSYLEDPFGKQIASLVDLASRDVVVLFDFQRYQRSTLELARHARRRDAAVVLITDERLSPASADAKVVIPLATGGVGPFDSMVCGLLLVEGLLLPIVRALDKKGQDRTEKWDSFRSRELLAASGGPEQSDEDPLAVL